MSGDVSRGACKACAARAAHPLSGQIDTRNCRACLVLHLATLPPAHRQLAFERMPEEHRRPVGAEVREKLREIRAMREART